MNLTRDDIKIILNNRKIYTSPVPPAQRMQDKVVKISRQAVERRMEELKMEKELNSYAAIR